jgi:hypothetical protein
MYFTEFVGRSSSRFDPGYSRWCRRRLFVSTRNQSRKRVRSQRGESDGRGFERRTADGSFTLDGKQAV